MTEDTTITVDRKTADKLWLIKRQGRFSSMDELILELISDYERLVKE